MKRRCSARPVATRRRRLRPCRWPSCSLPEHDVHQGENARRHGSSAVCRLLPLRSVRSVGRSLGRAICPQPRAAVFGRTALSLRFSFPLHENDVNLFVGLHERLCTMRGVFAQMAAYAPGLASQAAAKCLTLNATADSLCPWPVFSDGLPRFSCRDRPLCHCPKSLRPPLPRWSHGRLLLPHFCGHRNPQRRGFPGPCRHGGTRGRRILRRLEVLSPPNGFPHAEQLPAEDAEQKA